MSYFGDENEDKEALQHICSALSRDYKVKIILSPESEGSHANLKSREITIGIRDLSDKGLDFCVGKALHEVAHIRHTPGDYPKPKKKLEFALLNMLEDERIEEIIGKEYPGGRYYLSEMHEPPLMDLDRRLDRPLHVPREFTIRSMTDMYIPEVRGEMLKVSPEESEVIGKRARQKAKSEMFMRTISLALLKHKARFRHNESTGSDELDLLANGVMSFLRKSKNADTKELPKLADEIYHLLADIIPDEEEEKKSTMEGEGTAENGHVHVEPLLSEGRDPGGHGTVPSSLWTARDVIFTEEDKKARDSVSKLKRKLIGKMRENSHQRFAGNKRRGLINKRSVSRIASKNYRVYRKREEIKGRDYSVAILVDTSGSMFMGVTLYEGKFTNKIKTALFSTSLLARTFRGMGFPTSITMYGHKPKTVLTAGEIYRPDYIQAKALNNGGMVYHSGGNETHLGIKECLWQLEGQRADRQKLLIIITDGGLDDRDITLSRELIGKADKAGVQTFAFYVETGTARIVPDKKMEKVIQHAGELIPACISLAQGLIPL